MKSDMFQGRYLFHIHTDFTDGHLSVRDYFAFAEQSEIETLIFLEHIRKQPTYSVDAYVEQIHTCAAATGVRALVGFETKVCRDGSLDISEHHLAIASVVGIAEHGSATAPEAAAALLENALTIYPRAYPDIVFVWVHPGRWFSNPLSETAASYGARLLNTAQDRGVLIERNLKHRLVTEQQALEIERHHLVLGSDAHNRSDLEQWNLATGCTSYFRTTPAV